MRRILWVIRNLLLITSIGKQQPHMTEVETRAGEEVRRERKWNLGVMNLME